MNYSRDGGTVNEDWSESGNLVPELQEYDRQFAAIRRDAQRLLDGLGLQGLAWHSPAGTWSIGDCLNHLVMTGNQSLSHIRDAIVSARSKGLLGGGPFRHPVAGRLFILLMDAPPRIRFRVPKAYRPMPDVSVSEIAPMFFVLQDELTRLLQEANGVDLARVKVRNPVSDWFKMSLGQEFALTAAHERRHLWQAWQVRQRLLSRGVAV